MATKQSLSGPNLGTVLETYGGKSLRRILTVGAAIFGCGLTGGILIRVFRPDYLGTGMFVIGVGLFIALGYMKINWEAALATVEVCAGGLRFLGRGGLTWDMKGYLACWSGLPSAVELPWDRIRKVKVGRFRNVKGRPEHVVIRTTDGKDIAFPFYFWAAVETKRFSTTVHRFVEDVEDKVEFV